MALISKNPNAKTVDGVAAKVAYPALVGLVVGVALCVLDQLGVVDIEDELWLGIIGTALGGLGIGAASPAALQASKDPADKVYAGPQT